MTNTRLTIIIAAGMLSAASGADIKAAITKPELATTSVANSANTSKSLKVKFVVTDAGSGETLIGAAVILKGSTTGATTDLEGAAEISLKDGDYPIEVSYIGYSSVTINLRVKGGKVMLPEGEPEAGLTGTGTVTVSLTADNTLIDNATVMARKSLESISALQKERQMSAHAIENMGSKEMSLKGLSNAQESIAKFSGISIAEAGQMIVRGLGDRYSSTTLNGLPIASPNPDNKLIPLDIFPASTIQNITVSKVYEAGSFADYSGAHVDISTSKGKSEDFLKLSFSTGGWFGTLFDDFSQMDRKSLFVTPKLGKAAGTSDYSQFQEYSKTKSLFGTSFQVDDGTALPDFNGGVSFGKNWKTRGGELGLLASASANSGNETLKDAYYRTYEASSEGLAATESVYDSYTSKLDMAALVDLEYSFKKPSSIGLTFFFARNAMSSYQRRSLLDHLETYDLIGSNSVSHFYSLKNLQLTGRHSLADGKWDLDWGMSYSGTSSDEPDRRQVMFSRGSDGSLGFFNLNQQETQRYFGNLSEDEVVADVRASRVLDDDKKIRFGLSAKDKSRDFSTTRFYYNMKKITGAISDIGDMDQYLNDANIESGLVGIDRKRHKRDSYNASNKIMAAFAEADLGFGERVFLNAGLRAEASDQGVKYNDDVEDRERHLKAFDLFPAVNIKYSVDGQSALRLALSRTITRPSFIEMAPFLYQESFGGTQLRGNESLKNGYNWNVDLKYEYFADQSEDMFTLTGYFKYLDSPIERTQRLSGGAVEQTFQNADNGLAAGIEAEFRKEIVKDLSISGNASYIFTNVKLPESGAYTNKERTLQGASPYLINADISYTPTLRDGKSIGLALIYSVQGPRIHAVGILGLGDEKQMPFHSLDFSGTCKINKNLSVRLGLRNILNSSVRFTQEIPAAGRTVDAEGWRLGTGADLGITYNF